MNPKCAVHPDRVSVSSCSECQTPMCGECETRIAGKPVCPRCVANIRAKVASELGSQDNAAVGIGATPPAYSSSGFPAPPAPEPETGLGAYQTPPQFSAQSQPQTVYSQPSPVVQEPPSPARILVGIVAGLVVGAIGALVWDKFVFYTRFEFGLIASFIGFAVGVAVAAGSGRHGMVPAVIGGVLAFGAMMFGHYLLIHDEVAKEFGASFWPTLPQFMDLVKVTMEPMDWIFIAIGVWGGFSVPLRAGQPSNQGSSEPPQAPA